MYQDVNTFASAVSFTMGTDSLLPLLDTRGTAGLALKVNDENFISKQNHPELDSYTQTFYCNK